MKKRNPAHSLRKENKSLKERVEWLSSELELYKSQCDLNENNMRHALAMGSDNAIELRRLKGEFSDVNKRLTLIEKKLLTFINDEQRSFAKEIGVDVIEYALNYMTLLYNHRHLIQEVRSLQ